MKEMGVYKSDSEIWTIAEEYVVEKFNQEVSKNIDNALKIIRRII